MITIYMLTELIREVGRGSHKTSILSAYAREEDAVAAMHKIFDKTLCDIQIKRNGAIKVEATVNKRAKSCCIIESLKGCSSPYSTGVHIYLVRPVEFFDGAEEMK